LRRLGSGWAIFVEAQRSASTNYPNSQFPDPVSALIDSERKAQFEEEGAHFESAYFLTILFLPPSEGLTPTLGRFSSRRYLISPDEVLRSR
jgi:type IV secretory pathway VirB4 component